MKRLLLLLFISLITQTKAQDFDGSFSGLYAGAKYSFIQSDLFKSSGGIGYQIGYSHGFFLHDKGDLVLDIEASKNTIKLSGIYNDYSEYAGQKVEDAFNFMNFNLNSYYNHYLVVNDEGNGFYVTIFGGIKFLFGNQWEIAEENRDQDYIYYTSPYINYKTFEDMNIFNMGYELGASVGTYKYRLILSFNHTLTNLFRDQKIYKEYDQYNMPVEEAGVITDVIKLNSINVNFIFKL